MEYSENEMRWGIGTSFVVGVVLTVLLWVFVVDTVERSKVNAGYLTFKGSTYKVVLYDTLDKPKIEE